MLPPVLQQREGILAFSGALEKPGREHCHRWHKVGQEADIGEVDPTGEDPVEKDEPEEEIACPSVQLPPETPRHTPQEKDEHAKGDL